MSWFIYENPSGSISLSPACQDVMISILPTACALVAVALAYMTSAKDSRLKPQTAGNVYSISVVFTGALAILFPPSLVLGVLLRGTGTMRMQRYTTIPALATRLLGALAFLAAYLLKRCRLTHTLGFWVLSLIGYGAIRIHTFSAFSMFSSPDDRELALASLEVVIVSLCLLFILIQTAILPPFGQGHYFTKSRQPEQSQLQTSEHETSTLGILFFLWSTPLLRLGSRVSLHDKDLARFSISPAATYQARHATYELNRHESSILPWIVNGQTAWVVILGIVLAAVQICQPLIIQALVKFLNSEQDSSIGTWLIVAFSLSYTASPILSSHASQQALQLGYRFRAYLIQRIFISNVSKGLRTPSPPTPAESSQASVRVSVDTMNVQACFEVLIETLTSLIVVGVGSYILYRLIGLAFLGSLILACACTAVPFVLGNALQKSQRAAFEATERRIEETNSLILNVRSARLEDTEQLGFGSIQAARQAEINRTAMYRRFDILILLVAGSVTSLCILVSFALYPVSRGAENLDYGVLFSSLSVLSIMISPLMNTIQMLPVLVEGYVSFRRVLEVIQSRPVPEQVLPQPTTGSPCIASVDESPRNDPGKPATQEEASLLHWKGSADHWNNFEITLRPAQTIVLSGTSGSGKSQLMASILQVAGEALNSSTGIIGLHGISYCDQTPWFIPQTSVLKNVIFGKDLQNDLYEYVLDCCCLQSDIASFHTGHDTIIQDSVGSNLSGGQRKRIALARALYNEPALLVLDDVFSGLDSRTQAEVENNIFGEYGYLSKRPQVTTLISSTKIPSILQRPGIIHLGLEQGRVCEKEWTWDNHLEINVASEESKSTVPVTNPQSEEDPADGKSLPDSTGEENNHSQERKGTKTVDEYRIYISHLGGIVALGPMISFVMVNVGIEKGGPFWLSYWASQYESAGSTSHSSGYYIGVYAAFTGVGTIGLLAAAWIYFMKMIPDSGLSIHSEMLTALAFTSISELQAAGSDILNLFVKDAEIVDLQLPLSLLNFIYAFISIVGSAIVLAIPAPYTLTTLLAIIPLLYFVKRIYVPTTNSLRTVSIASQAPILSAITSSVAGRDTIMAYRALPWVSQMMHEKVQAGQKPGYLFKSLQTALRMVLGLSNTCMAIVLAVVVVKLRDNSDAGTREVGWAGVALTNTVSMGTSFTLLMTWWVGLEASMGSIKRIMDFTGRNPPVKDRESRSDNDKGTPSQRGRIQLSNLMVLRGPVRVIDGISLSIEPGQKVAIIGRTGSGKSTLVDSIFRLVDTAPGQIVVDGVDLAMVDAKELRQRIVGMGQSSFFAGHESLIRNIDPSGTVAQTDIERSLVEILGPQAALEVASYLQTAWSQCKFSSGLQRHLAMVRMLLRQDGHIYVLDEPTTGLDDDSHTRMMETMLERLSLKTVICVTHNLQGLEKFDQVFVLDKGHLVKSGSPAQLLRG